jgi:hypothetical protein
MKTIELFSGTKSASKVFKEQGWETFTIDNDADLEPDLVADIFSLTKDQLPYPPDLIWASPPCTTFSVASISHYWTKDKKPKNEKTLHGIAMLEKAIRIIKETNPKYWFIENPRGMMRKIIDEVFERNGIQDYRRITVSYCQYGSKIMKPTDIWTNLKGWNGKMCKNGAPCHERAGRGSKTGVQGIYNLEWERARGNSATARGVIPPNLFKEIISYL